MPSTLAAALWREIHELLPDDLGLPRIGRIRLKERASERGFEGRILSATITRRADRWFCSLAVEREREVVARKPIKNDADVVGVDIGLTSAAVIHDGIGTRVIEPSHALRRNLVKLRRLDRQLARKQRCSRNREKATLRRARLYYRIWCQRNGFLHQLSSSLAKAKPVIVLEDLNIRGMERNPQLALSVGNAGLGQLRLDRDENAAINLRRAGLGELGIVPLPEGLRKVTPVGEEGSGSASWRGARPASMKQEATGRRSRGGTRRSTRQLVEVTA